MSVVRVPVVYLKVKKKEATSGRWNPSLLCSLTRLLFKMIARFNRLSLRPGGAKLSPCEVPPEKPRSFATHPTLIKLDGGM